jgi:2-polyprenyl-3-methyl-5-hydroxy-6-metoxy-1,4-benzoquinol methylase
MNDRRAEQQMSAPRADLDAETVLLHVDMLNDRTRTSSYLESIRRNVRPGDVVLDIGTGTGIYAMAAARAGARHVYAIEAGPVASAARALFEANELSDRITLLRGWSTDLSLPERADVLISEVIGNEPLAEGVVGVTKDALKRLVKPDARLVPSRIRIYGLPVSVPNREIGRLTFTQETLSNWKSWYGFDFDLLAKATRNSMYDSVFGYFVNPKMMEGWKPLSEALLFADIDFRTWRGRWINNTQTVRFNASGQLNAMVTFFELYDDNETDEDVDEDIDVDKADVEADETDGALPFYTSDPDEVDRNNHWLSPVRIFVEPLEAKAGNSFDVTYWYGPEKRIAGCKVRLHE